jgi:hypothetical protein
MDHIARVQDPHEDSEPGTRMASRSLKVRIGLTNVDVQLLALTILKNLCISLFSQISVM